MGVKMDYKEIISNLKTDIKKYNGSSSHDYYHFIRVFHNAVNICKEIEVTEEEEFIVLASALLHDIGKKSVNNAAEKDDHEKRSSLLARSILVEYRVSEKVISMIENCILNHRASKKTKDDDILVQILCDADRLDALGAIAIARTFSYDSLRPIYLPEDAPKEEYDGVSNSSLNHIIEKVLKLTPETFYTESAKRIAKGRLAYAQNYVEEFLGEWNGER